MIKYLFF